MYKANYLLMESLFQSKKFLNHKKKLYKKYKIEKNA